MSGKDYKCDFCGKTRREADVIIAGKNANICGECIALSVSILTKRKAPVLDAGGECCSPGDEVSDG